MSHETEEAAQTGSGRSGHACAECRAAGNTQMKATTKLLSAALLWKFKFAWIASCSHIWVMCAGHQKSDGHDRRQGPASTAGRPGAVGALQGSHKPQGHCAGQGHHPAQTLVCFLPFASSCFHIITIPE